MLTETIARWRAKRNHAPSMTLLGQFAEQRGLPLSEANAWYEKAAALGDAQAMWNLGVNYLGEKGGKRDFNQAVDYLRQAAAADHPLANWALGRMHLAGRLVTLDPKQAVAHLERAAQAGHIEAAKQLAGLYASDEGGVEADPERAALYRDASQSAWQRWQLRAGLKRLP